MLLGINLRVLSLIVIVLTMLSISRLSVLQGLLRIWSGFSFVLPLAALGIAWFLPMPFYLVLFFFVGAVVSARTVSRDAVTVELSTEENRVLYAGIIGTLNLSIVVVPILLGSLIAALGYPVVFVAASGAALLSLFFLRRLECPVDYEGA
jgi:MFS family permease